MTNGINKSLGHFGIGGRSVSTGEVNQETVEKRTITRQSSARLSGPAHGISARDVAAPPRPLCLDDIASKDPQVRARIARLPPLDKQPLTPALEDTLDRRPSPVVANNRRPVKESRGLLEGSGSTGAANPSTLLRTSYAADPKMSFGQKVTSNLFLDVNMYFEERLQRALEECPQVLEGLKSACALIHEKLSFSSLENVFDEGYKLKPNAREARRDNILKQLKDSFPSIEIEQFVALPDWHTSKSRKEFLTKAADAFRLDSSQVADLDSKLSFLKMMDSQYPYFGGSVQYKEDKHEELEFWMYHLSTLAKDPDRHFDSTEHAFGMLPKPIKDYRTVPDGMVPFMNQHNLGTGIHEAQWSELPSDLRPTIELKLNKFLKKISEEGDNFLQKRYVTLLKIYESATNGLNADAKKYGKTEMTQSFQLTASELWNYSTLDDRKTLYGEITQLPWSDAHLTGAREDFSSQFDHEFAERNLATKHPYREGPGLLNVAGVFGNILETPATAKIRYANAGGSDLENEQKKNNFFGKLPGLPENQSILAEFESKHADWYENAYNNQKPIVGGISGHTLAYLNLYAAALKEVNAEDRGGYPSPEMLRAALMAGLIGHKRHHSYDEVMTASTAVDFEPRLTYVDRAGYSDLFNSGDPDVKKSAAVALSEVKQDYFLIKDKSVFKEIGDRVDAAGLESVQNVLRSYMDTINQRSAPMAATAKKLTEEVIGQLNFG